MGKPPRTSDTPTSVLSKVCVIRRIPKHHEGGPPRTLELEGRLPTVGQRRGRDRRPRWPGRGQPSLLPSDPPPLKWSKNPDGGRSLKGSTFIAPQKEHLPISAQHNQIRGGSLLLQIQENTNPANHINRDGYNPDRAHRYQPPATARRVLAGMQQYRRDTHCLIACQIPPKLTVA